jgi:hypothetical protein
VGDGGNGRAPVGEEYQPRAAVVRVGPAFDVAGALELIAGHGPAPDRQALTDELKGSPTLTAESASELLARLEAEGLIRGGRQVELTPEGQALYHSLSEYVAVPRVRLLSQFNPDDIETTVRTLQAIAERAAAEASSPGAGIVAS